MLKLICIAAVAILVVCLLIAFVLLPILGAATGFLMDFFGRRKEAARKAPEAPVDEVAFGRLAREAMAFSTRPFVTTISEVHGTPHDRVLTRVVSDTFGRRYYVETQRQVGEKLHTTLCAYFDGKREDSASVETSAADVRWDAYGAALDDLRANGPHLSFLDDRGRRRETRLGVMKEA